MDADKRLPTNQRTTSTDQEHETSPPGGMIDDAGLPRQAGWQGSQGEQQGTQQSATALKEQQATDLGVVKDVAAKDIDKAGGGEGDTFESKT